MNYMIYQAIGGLDKINCNQLATFLKKNMKDLFEKQFIPTS